jgi:hypothetical protein
MLFNYTKPTLELVEVGVVLSLFATSAAAAASGAAVLLLLSLLLPPLLLPPLLLPPLLLQLLLLLPSWSSLPSPSLPRLMVLVMMGIMTRPHAC